MTFWQHFLNVAGPGFILALAIFLLVAPVLFALKPAERSRIRAALALFGISVLGLLTLASFGFYGLSSSGSVYRWMKWASLFCGSVALVSAVSVFIFDVFLDALRLKPAHIMRELLRALSYVIIGVLLLSTINVDVTGIVATSAVLTAVIGLSFQDTLINVMGGMALQTERAIGVGDWIKVDGQEGIISDVRWRYTSIETRNWDTIVIPNSVMMKSQVTILGRRSGEPRQHRQWVYFNVDFRFSPAEVIDTVETSLRAEPIPNIALNPPPNCVLMDFKESYCSYAVRYWLTDLAIDDPTNSVVRTRLYSALKRADIGLSIPAHSIFVTDDDTSRRERKLAESVEERARVLGQVELFKSLTEAEQIALAGQLRPAPFVKGEAMTRQGAEAHWLYVITRGEAEVRVSGNANLSERIATLGPGDFFGEMGMMTGEPRRATVVALSEVECYRLDKESFNDIIQRRPEIAERISEILARRSVELEAVREDLNEGARQIRMRDRQSDLLKRIRGFFRL
jgi:small-conductance mechanosensitive channel/CRP-like cAMP-binding protein